MRLDLTARPERAEIIDHLVERAIERDLRHVLAIVRQADRPARAEHAAVDGVLADEGTEEGRLPCPVRADDADAVTAHDARGHVVHEQAIIDGDAHVLGRHDLVATALGDVETDGHGVVLADRRA